MTEEEWKRTDEEIRKKLDEVSEKLKIADETVGDIIFNIWPIPDDFKADIKIKF